MYCRECHYDLRGQTEPRCSECGLRCDLQDGNTYLLQVPTGLQTVLRNQVVKTFAKLLAIAVFYGTLVVLFFPGLYSSRCGPVSGRIMSHSLLYSICQAHFLNVQSSSEDGTLTIEQIRPDLARSWYSRSVEPQRVSANRWNRKAADILPWSVLAIGPVLVTIVFTRRWLRKLAITLASVCALVTVGSLMSMYVVSSFRRTSSYAYLADYVLVPGVDWRRWESSPSEGIVAFEKKPWPRSLRVVARNPWTVRTLKERKFQQLLSEQPVAKRAWDECLAAGECTTIRK